MALHLLSLSLILLGTLQMQAEGFTPKLITVLTLRRVPVQRVFQNEQFQGKWYVLGLAGNGFNKEKHSKMKMFTATYELNEDNSYNVTSTVASDENCSQWTKIFIPNLRLSQFNLSNIAGYIGVQKYTPQVVTTNYNQFAILQFKNVYNNQEYIKVNLYGRTKELPTVLRKIFINFAKSLGLTDDNIIFTVPTDECTDK
ncbi:neutrophil gelatinase-associated lipocalin-like [Suricata suricatta]|uniref:neutrophil gelatinase-associated lipocalin-like n=1 Tax=Suricata suricatta TaxID=37032 RepID=UPI001155E7B2|nr:neutrophil gelatinase-associated lipocalin-like [Suricata suricatta]